MRVAHTWYMTVPAFSMAGTTLADALRAPVQYLPRDEQAAVEVSACKLPHGLKIGVYRAKEVT